jgi:hypothetical protein
VAICCDQKRVRAAADGAVVCSMWPREGVPWTERVVDPFAFCASGPISAWMWAT